MSIVRSLFLGVLLLAACNRQPGTAGVEELAEATVKLQREITAGRKEIPLKDILREGEWQAVCVLLPYGTIDAKKIGREFDSMREINWIMGETYWAILIAYSTKISVIKLDRRLVDVSPAQKNADCFDDKDIRLVISRDTSRGGTLMLVTK